MSYSHIDVRKLRPGFAAEIGGVDLTRPLAPEVAEEIRRAYSEFSVLAFRNQVLDIPQLKAFGQTFGKLYIHPVADLTSEHPEMTPIFADETSTKALGEQWHSDASCDEETPSASILTLQETPEVGGDTMFCNMNAAYEGLSTPLKKLVEELTAVHDGGHVFRRRWDPTKVYPRNEHPVVVRHPESGKKLLFVNEQYTTHIVQLNDYESDMLLQMIYRHMTKPEYHFRFEWDASSVVVWDNRAVQHRATFDYWPARRMGTRVQTCGTRPIAAVPLAQAAE